MNPSQNSANSTNYFLVLLGPTSFGIQHMVQLLDFWISYLLLKRFDTKFAKPLRPLIEKAGSQGPTFEDYKRCWMGFISLLVGLTIAVCLPSLRILGSTTIPAGRFPDALDIVLTAIVFASGTEGANTIIKYLSAVKEGRQIAAGASPNALPGDQSKPGGVSSDSDLDGNAVGGGPFSFPPGGILLQNIEVTALYWGETWESDAALKDLRSSFDAFLEDFVPNTMAGLLRAFSNVGSAPEIGSGLVKKSIIGGNSDLSLADVNRDPSQSINLPSDIWPALTKAIVGNQITVNVNTHFCILLPPGCDISYGQLSSCSNFAGYHSWTDDNLSYSVIAYPCPKDFTKLSRPLDILTWRSSHELCESVTNPIGNGWTNQTGEVCDPCQDTPVKLGKYQVSKVASMDGICN